MLPRTEHAPALPVAARVWVEVLCRAGVGGLPRGFSFAARLAPLPRGWRCFAAWVALCLLGCLHRPQAGQDPITHAAKLHPRGKAPPPDLQSTTTHAAKRHPRGKPPPPTRQRSGRGNPRGNAAPPTRQRRPIHAAKG